MINNNKIFEEQKEGALEKMKKIGREMADVMASASRELSGKKRELMELLKDVQDGILKCSEKEEEAFTALHNSINKEDCSKTIIRSSDGGSRRNLSA